MAKDLISYPDLVTGTGGLDLLADSVRKSAGGTDAFDGKDTFKAIVLTDLAGRRVTNKDLAGMTGANDVKSTARQKGMTRAYFVKIVENSPHAYLPDPCPQGTTGLADSTKNHLIQGMYTIAIDQDTSRTITKNSIVFVKLNKTDFSYDTDFGWITSVIGDGSAEAAQQYKCAKPSKAFSKREISEYADSIITDIGAILASPVDAQWSTVRSPFGMRTMKDPKTGKMTTRMHKGVDYTMPTGNPVYAIADGEVDARINNGGLSAGFGRYIYLTHTNTGTADAVRSTYAHLSEWTVTSGKVKKGDEIGKSGNTGRSTGPHLHFEIRVDGTAVDPEKYLIKGEAVATASTTVPSMEETDDDHHDDTDSTGGESEA